MAEERAHGEGNRRWRSSPPSRYRSQCQCRRRENRNGQDWDQLTPPRRPRHGVHVGQQRRQQQGANRSESNRPARRSGHPSPRESRTDLRPTPAISIFFLRPRPKMPPFITRRRPPPTTKIVSYLTGVGALAEQDDPGLHHLGRISMFPLFGKTMRGYGRRAPPPPPI